MGSSNVKSTSAFSAYPVVHLIANLRRMRFVSSRSDCTLAARAVTLSTISFFDCTRPAHIALIDG